MRNLIAITMIVLGVLLGAAVVAYAGYAVGGHIAPQRVTTEVYVPRPVLTTHCTVITHGARYAMTSGELLSWPDQQVRCQDGTVDVQVRLAPAMAHVLHWWHLHHVEHLANLMRMRAVRATVNTVPSQPGE